MTHTRLIKAPYFCFSVIVFLNMKIILVIVISLKHIILVFRGWTRSPGSWRGAGLTQTQTCPCVLIDPLKAQRYRGAWRCSWAGGSSEPRDGCITSFQDDCEKPSCRAEGWVVFLSPLKTKQRETGSEAAGACRLVVRKVAVCQSVLDASFLFYQRVLKTFLFKR